jgi:hypothetical protein
MVSSNRNSRRNGRQRSRTRRHRFAADRVMPGQQTSRLETFHLA